MEFSKVVRQQLLPIDGKVFDTKDDLDDALYPLFGPLQSYFTGKGHRDLADRMISTGDVKREGGRFIVKLQFETNDLGNTPAAQAEMDDVAERHDALLRAEEEKIKVYKQQAIYQLETDRFMDALLTIKQLINVKYGSLL